MSEPGSLKKNNRPTDLPKAENEGIRDPPDGSSSWGDFSGCQPTTDDAVYICRWKVRLGGLVNLDQGPSGFTRCGAPGRGGKESTADDDEDLLDAACLIDGESGKLAYTKDDKP